MIILKNVKISGTPGINSLFSRERFLEIYRTLIFRNIVKNETTFVLNLNS